MAHIHHLLKERNFICLWLGQVISQFGDKLNQMALIALLYQRFPNSSLELAKLLSFTIIPVFLIGPVAGAYVDRHNRRRIMIICDILRAGIVLLIPCSIAYLKPVFPIYIVVFLVFSATRFFLPSKLAIIPDVITSDKLLLANSLFSTTAMIATVVALGVSGLLIAAVGPMAGFFIDSFSYVISAIFISMIRPYRMQRPVYREAEKPASILREMYDGLQFIIRNHRARFVMWTFFVLMASCGSLYTVMIVFVQESLHSVTKDIGLLGSSLGLGLFLGTIYYGRFGARFSKEKAILLSFIMGGIFLTLFVFELSVSGSFLSAIFLTMLLGIVVAPIAALAPTIIHEAIPDTMRGKIFSSIEFIAHMAFLIFMFLGALLAEYIGRLFVLISVGALLTFFGFLGILNIKRNRLKGAYGIN